MVRHAARESQAVWSALGPINMGLPSVQTTHGYIYKSFPTFLPRERGNRRKKFNRMVPVIHPSKGRLWWPELVSSLPTVGARRELVSRGVRGVADTMFSHM
jgi:hypothetical protein